MRHPQKYVAEAIGTGWLVLAGLGSAVISAGFPQLGIGFMGVAFGVGFAVLTMAYAIGHISGAHLNPAVTVGLFMGGRFPSREVLPYIVAQVVGGVIGAALLYAIAKGSPGFDPSGGFASNGYGEHSAGKYGVVSVFLAEFLFTMMFVFIIMGATHGKAPTGFAPIAIGLGLVLVHLASIPVGNASVNPARSTATAVFAGGWALAQLWLFWVAPLLGGAAGGVLYRWLSTEPSAPVVGDESAALRS